MLPNPTVKAKVNACSKHSELGHTLYSFDLEMPRYLIPELSKHRVAGFNTASSRAISYGRMRDAVKENPFIFPVFAKKHPGMVAKDYFNPLNAKQNPDYSVNQEIRKIWYSIVDYVLEKADKLDDLKVSKQMINRLLEPFSYSKLIYTSSFWNNFFIQRCSRFDQEIFDDPFFTSFTEFNRLMLGSGDAEPNMMALADVIQQEYFASNPQVLKPGEWHLPNISPDSVKMVNEYLASDKNNIKNDVFFHSFNEYCGLSETDYLLVCISSANSARTSYTVIGSDGTVKAVEEDLELFRDLINKKHMTPHEHAQRAMYDWENASFRKSFVLTKKRLDDYLEVCYEADMEYETHYEYHALFGSQNKLFVVTEYGWCANYRGFVPARYLFDSFNQR